MSLIISLICLISTMDWYWFNFVTSSGLQGDTWLVLRGLALSVVVAVVVHRLVWITLDKIDDRFNNPRVMYTTMSQRNAADRIDNHLNQNGFFVNEDSLYGREEQQAGDLFAQKSCSLLYINPFLGSHSAPAYSTNYLQAGRGLDEVPVLGRIFRFFGEATWYTGDFSVWLQVYVRVYGLDDDCTLVKVRFKNISRPPIFNVWGPWTRTFLLRKIKNLIDATDAPSCEPHDMEEPDVPEYAIDDSADYTVPETPSEESELKRLWSEAGRGDPAAQLIVGNAFRDGIGFPQDYSKALRCYEFAAQSNCPDAQFALAQFYRDGIAVEADTEKFEQLVLQAAKGGNPEAMYEIGCWEMTKQKRSWIAYEWFEKAANLGHTDAMCWVADLLLKYGDCPDIIERSDGRGAAIWFREAAGRGNTHASYALGNLRRNDGQSVAALGQYRKAAVGGHAGAQFELGYCYLYGIDVNQNLRRARYWLEKSVEQGDEQAAEYLQIAEKELTECERIAASG